MAPLKLAFDGSGDGEERDWWSKIETALESALKSAVDWLVGFCLGENDESKHSWGKKRKATFLTATLALRHPYLIAFALCVVCAWPRILMLPWWFSGDGYRRMVKHTRALGATAAQYILPKQRRRKRKFHCAPFCE